MKELIEKLKKRANTFLINAESNFSMEEYDIAMFNLEQAAQLFLKAKILSFGVQFPKIHEIRNLMEICKKLGVNFERLDEEKDIIEDLELAYISSRYLPISFKKENVERALEFVKKLKEILWK